MERLFRLAEEISRGNQNAFDELYALTHKAVFLTAYGVLKDRMLAEDVMQDTYLAAFRGMERLREGSNVTGWLTTIARRLAINEYHRRKRVDSTDFSRESGLEARLTYTDKRESLIAEAAEVLDEESYEIVVLAVVAGYKRREIAKMKGLPISTVSWKYKKGLETLKAYLEKEEKR